MKWLTFIDVDKRELKKCVVFLLLKKFIVFLLTKELHDILLNNRDKILPFYSISLTNTRVDFRDTL